MEIIKAFYESRNEVDSAPMAAYMKNQFPFLGLKKPARQEIYKEYVKGWKESKTIDWEFIWYCWRLPEREFQYLALSYLDAVGKLLKVDDLQRLEKLITDKSWWDTVDSISPLVGQIALSNPISKEEHIAKWIINENIWLKRVSILFQLKFKRNTDTEFLEKAIISNSLTREFFVDKAIGWALREYSKTDKEWVKKFIDSNELSRLSVREASKYL
jgi:3-methyladenine DNA glycosylase AlkD